MTLEQRNGKIFIFIFQLNLVGLEGRRETSQETVAVV